VTPRLSVVVICFNMRREIARTLHSLSAGYQRGIDRDSYEVILVDNGSAEPPVAEAFAHLPLNLHVLHMRNPRPSPVAALNLGLAASNGALIGVMIDGARMVTPGMLAAALRAGRLHDRAIVFTQSLTLGHGRQWENVAVGYDAAAEDRLLDSIRWPEDGYRLFEIATWLSGETSERRWSIPFYESNALFMPRALWEETGGYDPAFESPGGGFASCDMFARATALADTQIVVLTGEATFHQIHGHSISTSSRDAANNVKSFSREYYRLRQTAIGPVRRGFWMFGGNHDIAAGRPGHGQDAAGASASAASSPEGRR
jgi:glycosyltransferase involved in cell wall biosynthesis